MPVGTIQFLVGLGATIVTAFLPPIPTWTRVIGLAFGVALILWGAAAFLRGRLDGQLKWRNPPFGRYISLSDAAARGYAKHRGSAFAGMAERKTGGDPNGIKDWFATDMSQHIAIYGRRLPDRTLERISRPALTYAAFANGATVLRSSMNQPPYVDLRVTREDLRSYLKKAEDRVAALSGN